LDYEIISNYSIDTYPIPLGSFYTETPSFELIDYKTLNLRHANPNKKWHLQITENYDTQDKLKSYIEETGKLLCPNDICFITQMPIYNNCYILKVGLRRISTDDNIQYDNISYIMIAPYIFHILLPTSHSHSEPFKSYFKLKSGYDIIKIFISYNPRTEFQAIQLLYTNNKISSMRRDILECISLNGGYITRHDNRIILYTININKKIIYIGLENIKEYDIYKYQHTNSVLFNYNIR
jgi:hypothetical protein